jgi:Peptidase family U32
MNLTRQLLVDLGHLGEEANGLPTSDQRFEDGAQYRVEIPSVEGPAALAAVLDEADKRSVLVHRVSSGTGVMLATDGEISEMVAMCAERGIELSLFVGPRGSWDIGAQSRTPTGGSQALRHEGTDQLVYAMEDLVRANDLGVRGALVADEGLLLLTREMKERGLIDPGFVVKGSVQLMASNPVSVRLMQDLGAGTYNVPPGLSLPRLASIRASVQIPLDMYVESPDGIGGFVRHYEIPEMVRTLAPVYLKFGLRNHPDVYPSGLHLEALNIQLGRERVRRAELGLAMLDRYAGTYATSELRAAGLAVPVVRA